MQALFYMDMRQDDSAERLALFCQNCRPPKKTRPMFDRLVEGVRRQRGQIDRVIESHSNNWKVSRMAAVDRNVIRIAVFEMLCCEDTPIKVSINEAIDIGKKYGTEESGAFINGILDAVHLAIDNEALRLEPVPPPQDPPRDDTAAPAAAEAPAPSADRVSRVKVPGGVVRRRTAADET